MSEYILINFRGKLKWSLAQAKVKADGTCKAKFCKNPVRPEHKKGKTFCPDCCERIMRKNNVAWMKWRDLRSHAKTRKIPFDITYDQWVKFWGQKPRNNDKWTVDRINCLAGYTLHNLQWLNLSDNSRKGATFDKQAYAEMKRKGITPHVPVVPENTVAAGKITDQTWQDFEEEEITF
jgi:hypothetical protein